MLPSKLLYIYNICTHIYIYYMYCVGAALCAGSNQIVSGRIHAPSLQCKHYCVYCMSSGAPRLCRNICLLVELFMSNDYVLQQKQAKKGGVLHLTNMKVHERYQKNLMRALDSPNCPLAVPNKAKGVNFTVHTLRALYVSMVKVMFDCSEYGDPYLTMICLGHTEDEDSISYSHVNIRGDRGDDDLRGLFGKLDL